MGDLFHGLPVRSLQNEHLRLDFLAEAGPRLVRLLVKGRPDNLLAEVPDMHWQTPHGPFYIRGGHRLWHAPEDPVRTYMPDNEGVVIEETEGGMTLHQPVEPETGIVKGMRVVLEAERPSFTIHHMLENKGVWPVTPAPWAITQIRSGGTAVLPQTGGPLDEAGLLPNRQLTLWPYSRWGDGRLHLHDDYIFVTTNDDAEALKIGYFNRQGWLAYVWQDILLLKRFIPQPDQPHPDMGCNTEIYTNDRFLELETLGPLTRLTPGDSVTHIEKWEIHTGFSPPATLDDIRAILQAYL